VPPRRNEDYVTAQLAERIRELEQEKLALLNRPLPPPPKVPSVNPAGVPRWAVGALFLVAGVGGIGSIAQAVRGSPADPLPQLESLRDELAEVKSDVKEIKAVQKRSRREDVARSDLTQGILCRLNGKPDKPKSFARGVDCDAVAEWEPPKLGELNGYYAKDAEWPKTERSQ
jgi:hypothetical protein